jgi:hypothetical protein
MEKGRFLSDALDLKVIYRFLTTHFSYYNLSIQGTVVI